MADFDIEFEKVVVAEGGYVNNPNDNGEETYLGISRKHNPDWDAWREIDNIKRVFGTKGINKRLKNKRSIKYKQRTFGTVQGRCRSHRVQDCHKRIS